MTTETDTPAVPATDQDWPARADVAQRSLEHWFAAPGPQLLHNHHPAGDDSVFNYWWLAHVVDVRIDAYHRTGDPSWLRAAEAVADNILGRNGGSPFNDYFDDMLWYALALLRLHAAGGAARHLERSRQLWQHVVEEGWNDTFGASLAWRKQDLQYKNTPANGPLVILSARLHEVTGDPRQLELAHRSLAWLAEHLVQPDGFVHDGVNREGDGRIDTDWRFTYNQGLYVGALLAVERVSGAADLVGRAERTALTALAELGVDGVFDDRGEGGDVGLFKGITYRYLGLLVDRLATSDDAARQDTRRRLVDFVTTGTDRLWAGCLVDGHLLPGEGWQQPPTGPVTYATMLSAIKACELRARLEQGRPADSRLA